MKDSFKKVIGNVGDKYKTYSCNRKSEYDLDCDRDRFGCRLMLSPLNLGSPLEMVTRVEKFIRKLQDYVLRQFNGRNV